MSFDIEATRLTTSLEKRIARLETLEEVGASTGGFWTLLEEQILTDNAQTVITFDNINQSYQTLAFIISAQWYDGGGSSPLRMRWNGRIKYDPPFQTRGVYAYYYLQNAALGFSFLADYIELGDLSGQGDIFTTMVAYIPDYHRDDGIKPIIWHAGGYDTGGTWLNGRGMGQFEIDLAGLDWRSDPLTKITFASYGGGATVFRTNSKFSMYGFGVAT